MLVSARTELNSSLGEVGLGRGVVALGRVAARGVVHARPPRRERVLDRHADPAWRQLVVDLHSCGLTVHQRGAVAVRRAAEVVRDLHGRVRKVDEHVGEHGALRVVRRVELPLARSQKQLT